MITLKRGDAVDIPLHYTATGGLTDLRDFDIACDVRTRTNALVESLDFVDVDGNGIDYIAHVDSVDWPTGILKFDIRVSRKGARAQASRASQTMTIEVVNGQTPR